MTLVNLDNFCGNQRVASTLLAAAKSQNVRHAYLITGAASVGKRTLARVFAQTLICQRPGIVERAPCGECPSCRKIARGVHPDVQTWPRKSPKNSPGTAEAVLTIEDVRELGAASALRPIEAGWRVMILDRAEAIQPVAQEALLKTLEEPPAYQILLVLSEEGEALLPTIRSRCERVDLMPVPVADIESFLRDRDVAAEEAAALALLAEGAPGWALRAIVQPELAASRHETRRRALEWVRASGFERTVVAFELAERWPRSRSDVLAEVDAVSVVWREVLRARLKEEVPSGLSGHEAFGPSVATLDILDVNDALRSCRQCAVDLRSNVRPRLALEAMVMQWPALRVR